MTVFTTCGGVANSNGLCMKCGNPTGTVGQCSAQVELQPSPPVDGANHLQIICAICAESGQYGKAAMPYEIESGSLVVTTHLCEEHAAQAQNAKLQEAKFTFVDMASDAVERMQCKHLRLSFDFTRDPHIKCDDCGGELPKLWVNCIHQSLTAGVCDSCGTEVTGGRV